MFVGKSALGLTLVAILSTMAAPILFQEPTPGRPDDVAELLPEDTLVFAEVVKSPLLLRDWKEYVGAYCTPAGKANVCKQVEESVKKALDVVPEKLLKDLEKGLPSLQRLAFAVTSKSLGEDFSFLVVATSSDADFFKRIVEEDLKVFAGEEKVHQGVRVLSIRKLGDLRLDAPLLIAAAGKRLLASLSWGPMTEAIDRAVGKGRGQDLRQSRMYQSFSATTGDEAQFRAFVRFPWAGMMAGPSFGPWNNRRASAHQMDMMDAILGFQKIQGLVVEAQLKPGQIASQTRLKIDPPCRLYDVFRQPAGPKDLLQYMPPEAAVVAHVNLKGGKAVWEDIARLIKRADEIEAKSRPGSARQQGRGDTLEQMNRSMEREVGFKVDDLAAAIGDELSFGLVGDDFFANPRTFVEGVYFLVRAADPAKAKEMLEKIAAKIGPYQAKQEDGADFWLPPQQGEMPVFALHKSTVFIATRAEAIKAGLKAASEGKGLVKELPPEAARTSKLISVRYGLLYKGIMSAVAQAAPGALPPGTPDFSKDLALDAVSTVTFAEEKDELRILSKDAGLGFGLQAGVCLAPVMMFGAMSRVRMHFGEEAELPARKPPVPIPDAAPLAPDVLTRKVKDFVGGLKADEVVLREDALAGLKALGKQAIPLIVEAARKESDPEVKGRLVGILAEWRAFEAFPELLKTRVDSFLGEFEKAVAKSDQGYLQGVVQWRHEGSGTMPFPYNLEPNYINLDMVKRLETADILESPAGMKAVAERLAEGKLPLPALRNLSGFFAFQDCSAAAEAIVAARQGVSDPHARAYLQAALGWLETPKARELVLAGFKDSDLYVRRASFLAAEKSSDPAVVERLIALLREGDDESKWNASFTLRSVTGGKATVNVYLPEDELKPAIAAVEEWWRQNKAAFRPVR